MVRVQSIVRGVLLAVVAVGTTCVHAEDAPTQTQTLAVDAATCVAPEVVANYETKLDALETERAQWQSQLVAASGQWKTDRAALEAQLAQEQALHKKAAKQAATARAETAQTVQKLEQQLRESEAQHTVSLDELKAQVAALEQTVAQLTTQAAEHRAALAQREADVSATTAKLRKSQDQVKALERDVASSRKKNEALRDELQRMDEKLTVAALLSSYYDEGVVLASNAVAALRQQLEAAQQGSTSVTQALEALEGFKKTVTDTTDKLYAEHLAATLDPLIADLRHASDPYLERVQPRLQAELARAKTTAIKGYELARQRVLAARADAVALLQQTEGVAPHAQTIVDASLSVLAAPLAYVAVRVALSLVWFVVRTAFSVLTLGYCCGLCARKRSKSKRKTSRKLPPSPGAPTTSETTSTTASKKAAAASAAPTSNNAKRASGKKK